MSRRIVSAPIHSTEHCHRKQSGKLEANTTTHPTHTVHDTPYEIRALQTVGDFLHGFVALPFALLVSSFFSLFPQRFDSLLTH